MLYKWLSGKETRVTNDSLSFYLVCYFDMYTVRYGFFQCHFCITLNDVKSIYIDPVVVYYGAKCHCRFSV